MESVESVCLTTDSWTSVTTENYLAVTAPFLNQDFQLESCLLDYFKFGERHTQKNLKQDTALKIEASAKQSKKNQ